MRRSLASVTLSQPKPFLALQLTSVNQLTVRFINTSKKNKDHHTIDVYDPEYVNVKKPEGPKTVKDFVDVKSQKVIAYLAPSVMYFSLLFTFSRIGFLLAGTLSIQRKTLT